MKICAISDTHNLHRFFGRDPWNTLPDADILIHCGDFSSRGTKEEFQKFFDWFAGQPHKHKIFIAGNHDRYLEYYHPPNLKGLTYLRDSGCIIDGVGFYGSPVHRKLGGFPFGINDDERFSPEVCDILITHGPPLGVCDDEPMQREHHLGSIPILNAVKITKPNVHLFGHVHYAETRMKLSETTFINCSIHPWLWKKEPVQLPVVFDYEIW